MNNFDSHSLYRDVIKRSFIITWRHPWLWIFGFFTTFLGIGGVYEMVIKKSLESGALFDQLAGNFSIVSISSILISNNLDKINIFNLALLFGALLLVLAIFAAAIWLAISSFGAMIYSSRILDKNKKLHFWKSFREGRRNFWRLLSINLLGKILVLAFLTLIGGLISLIVINNSVWQAIIYFFAFLILTAASLLISLLVIYGSCFTVFKSQKLLDSLHSAWKLFKENWVVSFEATALLFCLNLLAKAALFAAMVVFSVPFLILLLIFYTAALSSAPIVVMALWILTSIAIMILVGSFFSAFQIVAWTLLFDKIAKGGVLSKIHRIFG